MLGLCTKALACHQAGKISEAIAHYACILSLKPDLAPIHNNLGHALAEQGRYEEAAASYRRAIALKADDPEVLCNWGVALAELGRCDEAEEKYRRAIAANPDFASAHNNLGLLLKEKGRLVEARNASEQAIRLSPRNAAYYDNLAAVRSFVPGDRHMTALEALAEDAASLRVAEQIHLHFALAKAYDDTGRPEDAFRALSAGNALKRRQVAYDEATTLARLHRTRALFTAEFIGTHGDTGDPSHLPVFIVGMPRSGTTLIEQILASHPQVFGAGEIHLLDQAVGSIRDALPGSPPFPEMIADMAPEHFRALGAQYRERLRQRAPDAARITDKMPGNFIFAGLIHLALPNATIIHAVRDPIDTCMSCFAVHFTRGQPHTYDLAELGRYYRHYQAVMDHWRRVLPPGRIVDVRYEDLVSDLAGTARRIVARCGLPWDARCLDFHRTERPVRTASAPQVRQPIYRHAVGRWRRYEQFLGPLLAELELLDASTCTEDNHA